MTCMQLIRENPEFVAKNEGLETIMKMWSAPFTGLSVMNNRQTPTHRDNGGGHQPVQLYPYIILDSCPRDLIHQTGQFSMLDSCSK